jgi:hypothetical protein
VWQVQGELCAWPCAERHCARGRGGDVPLLVTMRATCFPLWV